MAYDTLIQQGEFTSDGTPKILQLRTDVDWVEVHNWTNLIGAVQWAGVKWYWQRGMLQDDAITMYHVAADQTLSMSSCTTGYNGVTYRGISLLDSSLQSIGAAVATTGITAAAPPLATTGATAGLIANQTIVRLMNTLGTTQFGGMDFTIGAIVANTSFELLHAPTPVASVLAGQYRVVEFDPMFYPRSRYITGITAANPAVVTMSVTHDYVVGQKVRLSVPAEYGMVEMDGLDATVTAVANALGGANTITLDVNSAAFTAFAFPLTGVRFSQARVTPLGTDTALTIAQGLNLNLSATENQGYIGIKLGTSSTAAIALGSAGGTNGDIIKWRAGKSLAVLNE